jgi:uncharacterized protein (TIGR03437 family)
MKNANVPASCCITILLSIAATAQESPAILQLDVEMQVRYVDDGLNSSQVAKSPQPVPPSANRAMNFGKAVVIGDIVRVNGRSASGAWITLENNVRRNPNPTPAVAISDATGPSFSLQSLEFLNSDGNLIGSIFGIGAVGSVTGWAIVGGTGAFVGAKGTIAATANLAIRTTSQAEDPSLRRIHGGGRGVYVIQLFPMFRPEVLMGADGPIVFHSDFSLVTPASPARGGETLTVYVKGLGPTNPSVKAGEAFASSPLSVATSPVEVLVNGKPSAAINQVGVPGTTDTYRVDFRVPDDIPSGTASVQISAAWITGSAVAIPVE